MDTPKQKAEELISKFKDYARHGSSESYEQEQEWATKTSIQITLICVNEILESTNNKRSFLVKNNDGVEEFVGIYDYWKQVKEEIEEL
jgi:hypothetical protein